VVIDLGVMRDTLARQERRIARLAEDLELERDLRAEEAERFQKAVADLEERLSAQQQQLALIAKWVDYFDRQMDEATRPVLDRFRRTVAKKSDSAPSSGRSG
jgi:CII-binding regulator of phage lambda lysogenization HflD